MLVIEHDASIRETVAASLRDSGLAVVSAPDGAGLEARRLASPAATLLLDGPSLEVRADPDRVTQVVGNLIDNALRATSRSGTVRVTVCGPPSGAGPAVARVEVTDSGAGVSPQDRERIFERLVRLEDAVAAGRGGGGESGAGLGLPIARGIARAHGGELVCAAPGTGPEHGAHFVLTLPVTPPASPRGPHPAP